MQLNNNNIDFLGISETWLTNSVTDSFPILQGYEIVRHESPSQRPKHGMALYVIDLGLHIITVYRPPSCSLVKYMQLADLLRFLLWHVVVQSDFNLPNIDRNYVSQADSDLIFFNTFISVGLHKIVESTTIYHSGNILDLFFCQ